MMLSFLLVLVDLIWGNQVLFDLFCGPYWNQLTKDERNGYPQFYFAGQNVDPVSLVELFSGSSRKFGG